MGYFRELPNLLYQSFLPDKKSSLDYTEVKNLFRRTKLRDDLQNVFTFQARYETDESIVTREKFYGANQLSYFLNPQHSQFLYANVNVTNDQFSPYVYQTITSAGYGRKFIQTNTFSLTVQAGPGYRRSKNRTTRDVNDNFVLAAQADVCWKINDDVKFTQQVIDNLGKEYNYIRSTTALTSKLTQHFAMEASFTLDYYSNIPANMNRFKKLDTTTMLGLVYNF